MKVVFLDFDGVIRVTDPDSWEEDFCPYRMEMLAGALTALEAKVVVCSDWRRYDNREQIADYLGPRLGSLLHEDWMTPIKGPRWSEILHWLHDHKEVEHYAILDDVLSLYDGAPHTMMPHLILCSSRYGFVPQLIDRLRENLALDV